jgi:nickel-dependent lactate racemase
MDDYVGRLAYGDGTIEGVLPRTVAEEGRLLPVRLPETWPPLDDVSAALDRALANPEGDVSPLDAYLAAEYGGGPVTVVVDDHTRPNVHTRILLAPLLAKLESRGVSRGNLRILVACGTHRPPRAEEMPSILGSEAWRRYANRVEAHDCDGDLETVGEVDGVPVEWNRTALESEVVLPLTDVDYHYFAGVAGGPKPLMPGLAGRAIITYEHLKMFGDVGFAPGVEMGVVAGNPVFETKRRIVDAILRAHGRRGGRVYAFVAVVDPQRRLVFLAAGETFAAHAAGRRALDRVARATVPGRSDVVVATAGHLGIDLYQAGKAFHAARRAVKPGGRILVLAPCPDGFGNETFRALMAEAAPLLRRTEERLAAAKTETERRALASNGIAEALAAVQRAAMADFRIGKQKPVDLFLTLRHVGWGNLHLLADGLTEEDGRILPLRLVPPGPDPGTRLRAWVAKQEVDKPTYILLEDPNLLIEAPPASAPADAKGRPERS